MDPDRRAMLLQKSLDAGDRARATNEQNVWMISSQSKPGLWYRVGPQMCQCEWWTQRQTPCRHIVRADAETAREQQALNLVARLYAERAEAGL